MAERMIEAEVIEERIVACPSCQQKNRLHKRDSSGMYKCGACRAALPNPFLAPMKRRTSTMRLLVYIVASLLGLLIIVVIVAGIASSPSRSESSEERARKKAWAERDARIDKLISEIGPVALPPIPTPTYRSSYRANIPSAPQPQPPARQPSATASPELIPPANGTVLTYTTEEGVAPFEIKSRRGTNYLLKLIDALSNQPVLTTYVHGGDTVNVEVPLGTYIVKYAYGGKWYGYDYLFGPKTSYSKVSDLVTFDETDTHVRGHTITLYNVPYGNLRTERIKPSEF